MKHDYILIAFITAIVLGVTFIVAIAAPGPKPEDYKIAEKPVEQTKVEPEEDDNSGPHFCMPCVGPHLNLQKGRIELFGIGPGIGF